MHKIQAKLLNKCLIVKRLLHWLVIYYTPNMDIQRKEENQDHSWTETSLSTIQSNSLKYFSIPFPPKKTHKWLNSIYRILFSYVANNDIQVYWYTTFTVRVCSLVCVCGCVKRAVRPQKAEWLSPCEGALDGLTRQRLASKRALGNSLGGHTHTHTNLKKVSKLFSPPL